ncbi:MAG: uroporphyrinogen-III C-methyltransferase, partial [Gammaproteobacteria bacterium]|nr:uroporphyrinogen-III C-methyltransferase [Gammaproteobacteria bacterium]
RAAIYANARLILEAAQLAFLRGDEAVYAERMGAAAAWVGAHFAAESAAARAWLAGLDELARVSPAPRLPDISGSLQALRAATGR